MLTYILHFCFLNYHFNFQEQQGIQGHQQCVCYLSVIRDEVARFPPYTVMCVLFILHHHHGLP